MAVIIIVEGAVISKQFCVQSIVRSVNQLGALSKRELEHCAKEESMTFVSTRSLSLSALYSVLRCFVVSSFMIDKNQVCSLKGIGLELQLIYYTKWAIYEKLREYSISPGNPHTKKIHIAHILCDNVATCLSSLEISNTERCDIRFFFLFKKSKKSQKIYISIFFLFLEHCMYLLHTIIDIL